MDCFPLCIHCHFVFIYWTALWHSCLIWIQKLSIAFFFYLFSTSPAICSIPFLIRFTVRIPSLKFISVPLILIFIQPRCYSIRYRLVSHFSSPTIWIKYNFIWISGIIWIGIGINIIRYYFSQSTKFIIGYISSCLLLFPITYIYTIVCTIRKTISIYIYNSITYFQHTSFYFFKTVFYYINFRISTNIYSIQPCPRNYIIFHI